jgi:hypothetical protein
MVGGSATVMGVEVPEAEGADFFASFAELEALLAPLGGDDEGGFFDIDKVATMARRQALYQHIGDSRCCMVPHAITSLSSPAEAIV